MSLHPTQTPRNLHPWARLVHSHWRVALGVASFLLVVLLSRFTPMRDWFQLEQLRLILQQHPLWALSTFVALFSLGNLLHIPGVVFLAAAVLVLGQVAGGLVTYAAAVTSCAVTFLTVRWFGGNAIEKLPYRFARRLLTQLHRHPLRNTVLLRTVFQTLPGLNYALALSGLRFRTYMAGSLLGLPLPIATFCFFFDVVAHRLHWVT